jgi:hypothetical protein
MRGNVSFQVAPLNRRAIGERGGLVRVAGGIRSADRLHIETSYSLAGHHQVADSSKPRKRLQRVSPASHFAARAVFRALQRKASR